MTGIYRFAERAVEITTAGAAVHRMCSGYETKESPDFSVAVTAPDIAREREIAAREDAREGIPPHRYSDDYLETLAVHRQIAERMPDYDTVMFHGSCIAVDGKGYIFTAESGTGKSTHTRLWRELLGDRAVMVNDDKPLLRIEPAGVTAFGTPWNGKHRLSTNIGVPLQGLCLLTRAEQNAIARISAREAFDGLLEQVYLPQDRAAFAKTVELLARLATSVKLYRLGCNMNLDAAELAYHAMAAS